MLRGSYAYVNANPIKHYDPTGLQSVDSPDKSINTVVCDGNGDMEVQLAPMDPLAYTCGLAGCITAHEQVHIADVRQLKSDVCKGQPKGMLVLLPSDVRAASEVRAAEAEIACLKNLLKNKNCAKCVPNIEARIQQETKYRDSFK